MIEGHGRGRGAWLAFVCALALSACAPAATLTEGELDPIRVGVVISLSGGLGADGPGWADAARLAALEINSAGGPLPGRPIELIVVDDETDPSRAEGIAQDLIAQDVVAIVGGAASSVSLGVAQVATPAQIPQLSCCSTSDLITEFNEGLPEDERYFFRTAPADVLQSVVVAIAADELACTRVAVLHLDDSYGMPFGIGIEQSVNARGGTVVSRVPFTDEQPTYSAQLMEIRDSTPDCIALVAFPEAAGTIVRDWAALSGTPDVTWIGTDGIKGPGFVTEAGNTALIDGFFGTSPVTDAPTPGYNAYASHFRAVWGTEPNPFSSNQYDAMALLALGIAQAGSTDGAAIRNGIRAVASAPSDRGFVRAGDLSEALGQLREGRQIDYLGGSGDTDFDALHNVVTPYEIWRYDGPAVTPCADSNVLPENQGSFCRFRSIAAGDIQ